MTRRILAAYPLKPLTDDYASEPVFECVHYYLGRVKEQQWVGKKHRVHIYLSSTKLQVAF